MNKLYLVRHGENKANLTQEFSCRKVDYPLTPKGVLQAEQTALYFQDKGIEAIYASPLKRAVETAQHISGAVGKPVQVLENFRELNVGDLEDGPPTEEKWRIHFDVIRAWLAGQHDTSFPGGENFIMATRRMAAGVHQVIAQHPGQSTVIVGHGGIFFTGMTAICPELNIAELISQVSHNCSITEVEASLQNGRVYGKLLRWADISHLSGEAANLVSGLPDER